MGALLLPWPHGSPCGLYCFSDMTEIAKIAALTFALCGWSIAMVIVGYHWGYEEACQDGRQSTPTETRRGK